MKMNLAYLVTFIYEINGAIDTGKYQDISIEEVEEHIEKGDLLPFLKDRFGEDVDLSLFDLAPNGIKLADELNTKLQNYLETLKGFEYKYLVENNGLCLLIAWMTEMIASLEWDPPRGIPKATLKLLLEKLQANLTGPKVSNKKSTRSYEAIKDRLDVTLFENLRKLDNLKKIPFEKCDCFLHDHHRWVLPIIFWAQEKRLIPELCTVVMFDKHPDAREPKEECMEEIYLIRESGCTTNKIISLCETKLNFLDDDWVIAGMELGLIGDIVIFGARWGDLNVPKTYHDHRGNLHRIELLGLPYGELEFKGSLSDICYRESLSELWDTLKWERNSGGRFFFNRTADKILLDFDLDCFSCSCMNYTIPWHDDVFIEEFFTPSEYRTTRGWTGKMFLKGLMDQAGLLTIAREPGCCGGPKHGEKYADYILKKVNYFLFDNGLLR